MTLDKPRCNRSQSGSGLSACLAMPACPNAEPSLVAWPGFASCRSSSNLKACLGVSGHVQPKEVARSLTFASALSTGVKLGTCCFFYTSIAYVSNSLIHICRVFKNMYLINIILCSLNSKISNHGQASACTTLVRSGRSWSSRRLSECRCSAAARALESGRSTLVKCHLRRMYICSVPTLKCIIYNLIWI